MKSFKGIALSLVVAAAWLPMTAGAFGFGASHFDQAPPPWAVYGPPGAVPPGYPPPPYGPPPYARNVKGMWGSGPGMHWGSRDRGRRAERPRKKRNPWKLTRDWVYHSPYEDARPARQPETNPAGGEHR